MPDCRSILRFLILCLFVSAAPAQTSRPSARPAVTGVRGSTYDVKAYGAKADGTSADWTGISAAIAAAGRSGRVIFPPGTYRVGAHSLVGASVYMETGAVLEIKDGEVV